MPARVYTYGLLDPRVNADLVEDQIRKAHRYRNILVEIERDRRAEVRVALSSHPDVEPISIEVDQIVTAREQIRDQIRRANAHKRGRADVQEQRAAFREVSARLKDARARLKAAKDMIRDDAEVQRKIEAADERANDRIRKERATCNVYWGNYLLQEAAADDARKEKTPPQFRRWTGEGRVSVQLQGGISLADLSRDTQVQLHPGRPLKEGRAVPRDARVLRLRVGSDEKKHPIWAEWPMILHRPLPEGARIKVVTVHKRRRDCRSWEWTATFQVVIAEDQRSQGLVPEGGVIALNLGFTGNYEHLGGALRAGYLVDAAGCAQEVVLPESVVDRVRQSEAIRSQRDDNLNHLRAELVAWLREHEAELPEWIVDRCVLSRPVEGEERRRCWPIEQWKSFGRFVALARLWRDKRGPDQVGSGQWNDEAGYALIEKWRYRDEHLERYESGMRRGALLHRREVYRLVAADLASKYQMLVVGSTDLRELQRSPRPEEKRVEIASAKYQQRLVAGSELRGALINAFRGMVATVDDDHATIDCHACGCPCEWDHAAERRHTCESCGASWDQDENYARNLLKRFEQLGGVPAWRAAREAKLANRKETRSERLRRTRWKRDDVEAARVVA